MYYETLYERLEARRDILTAKIEKLLRDEISKRWSKNFDEKKYTAYRDACIAFVEERAEMYNPIGIQYTFDRIRTDQASELELQLNWYDSRAEFEALIGAVRSRIETETAEDKMSELVDELIAEVGAFPDKSIISAYEDKPALGKLPDYIVARAIEMTINYK